MRSLGFNQRFSLDKSLIKGFLHYATTGEPMSDAAVGAYLGINPYKVASVRGWFCKLGLGNGTSQRYDLTPFGSAAATYDPELVLPGTLWLLHYYLVSEHDERAEIWYRSFNEFISPYKTFSTSEMQLYIEQQLTDTPGNRDAIKKDSTALIHCYTDAQALGALGLLVKPTKMKVAVATPISPDPLIVAFVLFDSWQRRFGATDSVRLSRLVNEPESIGKVFVANGRGVRDMIGQIERLGCVTFADTQLEPVTRRFFDDPLTLAVRYYQSQ